MPSLLVVDDDPAIIHAFRRHFQETDFSVLSAVTGAVRWTCWSNIDRTWSF